MSEPKKINMQPDEVKAFRKKFNLSSRDLAAWLGVTHQAVDNWEAATRGVPETTARLFKLVEKYPQLFAEFNS